MNDWLIKRLPNGREQAEIWRELANVLQEYWDGQFAPVAQELEDAKSLFSASLRDLSHRQAELGDFFSVELNIADESRPLAIAWRLREIHQKDSASIIDAAVERVFGNVGAKWEPLFNPIDRPYSQDNLFSETEYRENGFNDEEMLLTSRGRVWIDEIRLKQIQPNIQKETFVRLLRAEIDKVRPAHIVYDGEFFVFFIEFQHSRMSFYHQIAERIRELVINHPVILTTEEEWREGETTISHQSARPPVHRAFDELPSDYSPMNLEYFLV